MKKPPRHPGAHFWYQLTCRGAWTSLCSHARCRTCHHISTDTNLKGTRTSIFIKNAFTCQTSGLVHGISCRRCPAIYIGETWRALRQCLGEHLRSIKKNVPGFPVAKHFNAAGHCIEDVLVRGILLCGATSQRKRLEMRLIFKLDTSHPRGLKSDFHILWAPRTHCTFLILNVILDPWGIETLHWFQWTWSRNITRNMDKRRVETSFLRGLRYANVSLTHSLAHSPTQSSQSAD